MKKRPKKEIARRDAAPAGFPALLESFGRCGTQLTLSNSHSAFLQRSCDARRVTMGKARANIDHIPGSGSDVLLNDLYVHDKMNNIVGKNTEHWDYGYQYDDLHPPVDHGG